jgi:UDP-N-acetylglucosamine:LPS N-acetylglucosamine transferase
MINESELTAEKLASTIERLLNNPQEQQNMINNIKVLTKTNAANDIANIILQGFKAQ